MSDDPQRGNPLETAPIPTLLLRYSVPTALTLMVNFLYNIVDQIFIGRGVGISGMTATNIAFPLVILVGAVSLLLGDGCAAYVSLALGRRQQAEADAAVGQTVTLLLVSGIVLAALSALLAPQLVWLLGTTETAYAQSVAYLRTISVGIPFQLLCPALTAIVRADGSPQYTMRCMLAGALLNVALDALFIFPLAMGVVGAGIATVIGEAVSALLFLRYLPHMKTVQVRRENLRPTAARTGRILALGLPSLLTQMMTAAVQIVMNNLMRKYGAATIYGSDIALSVYGMMLKIYQIAHAMFVGVSSATQPINGFNFGAQHYDRVYRTYRLATRAALVISMGWFAVFMLLPRHALRAGQSPLPRLHRALLPPVHAHLLPLRRAHDDGLVPAGDRQALALRAHSARAAGAVSHPAGVRALRTIRAGRGAVCRADRRYDGVSAEYGARRGRVPRVARQGLACVIISKKRQIHGLFPSFG